MISTSRLLAVVSTVLFCTSSAVNSNGNNFCSMDQHNIQLNRLVSDVKKKHPTQGIVLKRSPAQSHCPRPHEYKLTSIKLDISMMTKIISVSPYESSKHNFGNLDLDTSRGKFAIAEVQAMASMEQLVDGLLPLGFIPAVVPEFKGITIGGSIQGLAAESTSFRYGFVHDTVLGFEALLSDGRVVWCSRVENQDLFYGLPGSFGSIAICTRAKILCIPAKEYVNVTCRLHTTQRDCVSYMGQLQDQLLAATLVSQSLPPHFDFLEGIGYSQNECLSISGTFVSASDISEIDKKKVSRCNKIGYDWFFNQAKALIPKLRTSRDRSQTSVLESAAFLLPTKDYLFRYIHTSAHGLLLFLVLKYM